MKKLTPWFPATIKPVRDGVYQCNAPNREWYRRYQNGQWYWGDSSIKKAARSHQTFFVKPGSEWRGLAVKP